MWFCYHTHRIRVESLISRSPIQDKKHKKNKLKHENKEKTFYELPSKRERMIFML